MKKPAKKHQLWDRHGNHVVAPTANNGLKQWTVFNIFQGLWDVSVEKPPTLLTGIYDQ
jgi:hypothetical protein